MGAHADFKNERTRLQRTLQTFRVPLTIFGYILLLVSFVVAFLCQVGVGLIAYPFMDKYRFQDLMGWIFRRVSYLFMIQLNPLWSLKVSSRTMLTSNTKGVIFMSNHLANADPFVLCSALLPVETKYIAKASLFKIPFGGWAMKIAGDLPVHFTKEKGGWGTQKGTVAKLITSCKELLQNGSNLAVFPEGIRSSDGRLQPFKDGMFNVALEAKADIIPVALSGPQICWPLFDWWWNQGICYVLIGERISSEGHTLESLKQRVRQEIENLQKQLPSTVVHTTAAPAELSQLNGGSKDGTN